ncbi:MAG: hypothetical protein IT340_23015 [Chloroflexi bacterium]|nr:hypothetical protein [Chloroflexota bacterium]
MTVNDRATLALVQSQPDEPGEVGDTASPPRQGRSWPLTPGSALGQIIQPRHDGLCAIEFLIALEPRFTGTLTCHVLERDTEQEIQRVSVAGAGLHDNRFARFATPPIPNTAGRAVYVWLETDAPGLGVYTCGPAGATGAQRDHAPIDTSLVYRTYAAGPDARWVDRQTIEHLLAAQADLTRALLNARLAIQHLTDERAAVERRVQALLACLMPPATDGNRG